LRVRDDAAASHSVRSRSARARSRHIRGLVLPAWRVAVRAHRVRALTAREGGVKLLSFPFRSRTMRITPQGLVTTVATVAALGIGGAAVQPRPATATDS